MKYALGKLTLGCKPDDLLKFADDMGFAKLPLTPEEAALFYQLPKFAHKDPFDRILIWQAIAAAGETADGKIGYLKALLADYDDDREALTTELTALLDSFAAGYLFTPEKYGVRKPSRSCRLAC